MNREQFIDVLFDLVVQDLLLQEDPLTFNDAVDRALNIDPISRGSRLRQRGLLATTRYHQKSDPDQCVERYHVQDVIGQLEPDIMKAEKDDMKKQVKHQADMIKEMSKMTSKFVNSIIPGPQKNKRGPGRKPDPFVQSVPRKQPLRPELCQQRDEVVRDFEARSPLLQLH